MFKKIETLKPDLIGMTTFSYCYDYAEDLINKIKEYTSVPLIIGGPHVSAVKKDILLTNNVDFAMKGESEISFLKFVKELSGGKNYSKVGNLIWRDSSGNIVENEMEPLIKDIDTIPFPSYESFCFERYNYFTTKTLPIITSRGCPY
ncbi:MAG: cobalamin B12-binding domain-containing protein [Actinobacteria bacterium]|nr:cobalamin B12-binding domain-containing protein [Actinomycetota bacterium]